MIGLNDRDYWDAHEAHLERTREIMAGDPDYSETQAIGMAHEFASKFTSPAPESLDD